MRFILEHWIVKRKPITDVQSKYYLFRFIPISAKLGRRLFFGNLLDKCYCGGDEA